MDPFGSAMVVLPAVFDIFGFPRMVIDVGCGDGSWLRAAKHLGVATTVGIDREPLGELSSPACGIDRYQTADLRVLGLVRPEVFDLATTRKFDLTISVEVAEHLPERCADSFISYLCSLSYRIVFSAAPPGQGPYPPEGTSEDDAWRWHLNEQPPTYWDALFHGHGFIRDDTIGDAIRDDERVDPWYRENITLYWKPEFESLEAVG